MNTSVGVVLGRADAVGAAVESAASVGMIALELAGIVVGGVCTAAAIPELFFGDVDLFDPFGVPFF